MDVPTDEHERTLAFAETALGQIKALGQSAAPRNFEIWYHYATGYNPPLNQTDQRNAAAKRHAQRRRSRPDLRHPYFDHPLRRPHRFRRHARAREINQVMSRSTPRRDRRRTYSQSLTAASEKLAQAKDSDALRAVIERLVQGANEMETSNQQARGTACGVASQEIEQLQQNLEAVRNESLTDPLTTLANRKYFDARSPKRIAKRQRRANRCRW